MVLRHFTTNRVLSFKFKDPQLNLILEFFNPIKHQKTLTQCSKKKNTHYGRLHVNNHTCPPCNVTGCHQHSNGGLKNVFLLFLFPTATSPSFSLSPSLPKNGLHWDGILSSSAGNGPASCFSPTPTHTHTENWGSSDVVHAYNSSLNKTEHVLWTSLSNDWSSMNLNMCYSTVNDHLLFGAGLSFNVSQGRLTLYVCTFL